MSNRKTLLLILLFAVISSCKKPSTTTNNCSGKNVEKEYFFSLKNYFCELMNTYNANNIKVNKRVSFGAKSETIENLEIDWNAEFATFINADINHSAWVDKFSIDTLKTNDGFSVQYLSNTPSIPVKNVKVDFNKNEEVKAINIETSRSNALYKSKQEIHFIPNEKYQVNGWQRTLFLSKTEFTVEGFILADLDTNN